MRPGLLEIESLVRREAASMGQACWPPIGSVIPGLRIGIGGPARSGKSTIARALLGREADEWVGRVERHSRTQTPVEYRFGQKSVLALRRPKEDGWTSPAHLPKAADIAKVLEEVAFTYSSARVEAPVPALLHWAASIVDLPPVGIEPHLDALALQELAACDGVLWVMHPRGLGDAEVAMLRRLDGIPVAFLSNVWEDHLSPTSLPVEVFQVPVREAAFPSAIPLIGANCLDPGEERSLLIDLLGVLRRAQWESGPLQLVQTLPSSIEELRATLAARAERTLALARQKLVAGGPLERLEALRALQAYVQRTGPALAQVLQRLKEAKTHAEWHARTPVEEFYESKVQRAGRLTATYNVRAGAKSSRGSAAVEGAQAQFGEQFIRPRLELGSFLQNALQSSTELMLGDHDVAALEGLSNDIRDGRVEIALLGVFSSGKSALVNRLLGVPINDRDSALLPTRPTVTTATVNRLEWAKTRQLNGVDWLEETELTLLQWQEGVGIRVREHEIVALRRWLEDGTVKLEDCEVEEFRPVKGTRPLLSDRALLENLFHMAGGPKGRCPDYLPHENQRRLPGKVRVARFRGDRPKLKPGMSLKEAFKLAERPEVSLQVAMLRIGYPHPLLEFGAIIDTPGTDSHVPHHRTLSRSLVRRRRVPVIYCFLSTQPGGIEDRNNIQILLEAGAETMQRVFFVITRKGDIPPPERDELRRHVKKRLDSFRMPVQGLHFIELVNFVDQEFEDLSRQLTEFIKEQQGPQLAAWSHRARDVFRQAQGTATSQLSNLDLEEKARARREAECAKRVHDLEAVSAAVSESREWGAPYARRRYDDGTGRPCSTIDEKIGELRHRSLFDGFNEVLDGDVATLNSGASRVIRGALGALHSKLTSEMGELHVDAPARFTVDEEQFFDASAAITAAERVDFSAWDAWWDGLSYGPQVEKARGSIARPWATAKGEGLEKSRKALENGIRHYKNEVNRALSKARRELEATKRMDPEAQERLRQRLKAARDLGKNWVKRFSDWERKYADQGSKS